MRSTSLSSLLLLLAVSSGHHAAASEDHLISGPVEAKLIRVVDGDTLLVSAAPWPEHSIETYVRLRGIDAPELHAKCEATRFAAQQARDGLSKLLTTKISLLAISGDKYYGRVLADIRLEDGRSVADVLLASGLVESYDGGRKHLHPC
ncbi:thermonuclease family protein [Ciceribacter ferrooxidans]|uniref:Thermonuclease family protein n=1 Tax=Ciceribacter ferrooxidans TaxID=2509717 RepID=A0A4Q2SI92_9HYPH|nr:thermonuclease family protein [Ciceribacter ferrooxidans]RYC04773.1 thermonuclease family protein [Ciceribacter ferrooxidans]